MAVHRVPVVVEVGLERITTIAVGTEIDAANEFEDLAGTAAYAPTGIGAPALTLP